MKIAKVHTALLVVIIGFSPIAVQGADWEDWPLADRWSIGVGYFVPNLDTQLVVTDADGNLGTGINFEKNLALDDSKGTVLLNADWRFFKRHTLSYRYFDLQRSATTTSSVSISVGDEVFDINLPIQSYFDITAHEIAYSYSLIFDEKMELFVGLGLSAQTLALGIQGTESSPAPGSDLRSTLESTMPLPTLNIGFDYAFSDKWLFQSRLGWLAVELDLGADEELSGEIINATVGITWKAFEHVGFYAQYQMLDVNVDFVDESVKFAVDYDYYGPVLGVSVNF
jgi:hypothetical protein